VRLKAILGGFKPCVKIWYFKSCRSASFSGLGDLSFSDSSWECTLTRFSPRNKKTTSEKDKNKPQKLGRFEIFSRGLILVSTFLIIWIYRIH